MSQFSSQRTEQEQDSIQSFIEKREKVGILYPRAALRTYQATMQRLRTVCTLMVVAWLVSWTPYLIMFLLPQLGLIHLLTPNVGQSIETA